MKIIFRSAVMAALLIATACGKDDAPSEVEEAQEQEELVETLESTPLEVETVSDNVVIAGSTKKDGMPPTPNEMISLDVSGTSKTAFLNEGFDIEMSSDADIVGAYIQFKANDGTVSSSYYDVDVVANSDAQFGNKSAKVFGAKTKHAKSLFAKEGENLALDVDFNAAIAPGTFCYVVCVYDADGNISAPSEVCATVESWGGSSAIVGNWNIVREENTFEDQTRVVILGEEDCQNASSSTFTCNNESVTFYGCKTRLSSKLTFNADGTYSYVDETNRKNINFDASQAACEAVYDAVRLDVYKSDGFWAFVKDEARLTIVEYKWSDTEDGVFSDGETYTEGNAELIFDGTITLNGDAFQIFEEYDFDGDGVIEDTYRTFLEK